MKTEDHLSAATHAFAGPASRHRPGSWIDMQERPGPSGAIKPGFRNEMFKWCEARGHATMPLLDGREWARHLPRNVRFRDRQKVRQVRGLRWNTGEAQVKLSRKWFVLEAFVVVVEVLAFFLLPLLTVFYAMVMQNVWGVLMCPSDGVLDPDSPDDRVLPLLWTDVAKPVWDQEPRYVLLLVRVIAWENVGFMLLTTIRLVARCGASNARRSRCISNLCCCLTRPLGPLSHRRS